MRDELLVHDYSDSDILMLVPTRIGSGHDIFLPLKQTYNANNLLQNIPFIYSSLEGGYYHVRLNFVFSINTLPDLANTTIALLILNYVNGIYQGVLDRIEYNLNGSGVITNTANLTKEYNFEIYLNKADHFNIAFSHEIFKSIALTISSLEIKIYQIADKKLELPSNLVTQEQLEAVLENYMRKSSYVNSDGTVGNQLSIAYQNLKNIPAQFPPQSHSHTELLSESEFNKFKSSVLNYLEVLRKFSHSHDNSDVISGFYLEGQILYFKGRRFMNYDDYLVLNSEEDISELLEEIGTIHWDILNFPPEEYFFDMGINLRWTANPIQTFTFGVWSTLLFNYEEVIRGDLVHKTSTKWRYYAQVPGVYTVSFFYVFDYGNDGLITGTEYNIRYGLFRNGIQYSVLDYDIGVITGLQPDNNYHFRSSCQGTDRIVLKLGDYIEIKVKHNLPVAIQPPISLSYGYINIDRCDTYGKEINTGLIPILLS